VVKTTLPLMLLIGLGFFLIRRYGAGLAGEAMLLLPAAFYYAVAVVSLLNIGHRHILAIYPFLIVFAAKVARAFDQLRARWLAVGCALLLAWNVKEALFIYPHFLAYFNQIAGGPANGYHWLVDSNLDWGQDLKGLAQYRLEHPGGDFYLCYFGNDSPKYRQINARLLPGWPIGVAEGLPGYARFDQVPPGATVAVSATFLQTDLFKGKYQGVTEFMGKLRQTKPIAHIGHSILIYRMP
jgi:hypothetical protein